MTSTMEWLGGSVMVLGASMVFIGALGLLRFPDVFTRISGTSVAGFTGVSLVFLGGALALGEPEVWARVIIILIALVSMIPLSSHALARFAYRSGLEMAPQTLRDDLARDEALGRNEVAISEAEADRASAGDAEP